MQLIAMSLNPVQILKTWLVLKKGPVGKSYHLLDVLVYLFCWQCLPLYETIYISVRSRLISD